MTSRTELGAGNAKHPETFNPLTTIKIGSLNYVFIRAH